MKILSRSVENPDFSKIYEDCRRSASRFTEPNSQVIVVGM